MIIIVRINIIVNIIIICYYYYHVYPHYYYYYYYYDAGCVRGAAPNSRPLKVPMEYN